MTAALPNDPTWLKAAFADLGVHEIPGPRHNARVLEMFKEAGHPEIHDDETAWCSAAANAWMEEGDYRGTRALNARSWLNWGVALDTHKRVPRGAVLVFQRGNSGTLGHVCFCLSDDGDAFTAIGGNQGDAVSIMRHGKASLLGARWPGNVLVKKPEPVPVPKPTPEPQRLPPDVPAKPGPEPDAEPVPMPAPMPAPNPQPEAPGWLAKLRNWAGGLFASGGAFYMDWRLGALMVVVGILGVAFLLWLFGRDTIRAWLSRHFA